LSTFAQEAGEIREKIFKIIGWKKIERDRGIGMIALVVEL
jgi:hypothetical protein